MPGRGFGRPPMMSPRPADRGAVAEAIFRRLDANHDGSITKAEFVSASGRMHGPAGDRRGPGGRDGEKKKAESKKDSGKKGDAKKGESKKKDKPKKGDKDDDDK